MLDHPNPGKKTRAPLAFLFAGAITTLRLSRSDLIESAHSLGPTLPF